MNPAIAHLLKVYRKLSLSLWKDFLLKGRRWKITAIEILFPAFWALVLLIIYLAIPKVAFGQQKGKIKSMELPNDWGGRSNGSLYYTPKNNVSKHLVSGLEPYFQEVVGFKNEKSMQSVKMTTRSQEEKQIAPWEVAFTNPVSSYDTIPMTLKYRITDQANYRTESWKQEIIPPFDRYADKFILIQHLIALKYLELISGKRSKEILNTVKVFVKPFPYPVHTENEHFWKLMEIAVPFLALLGFVVSVPLMTRDILNEKASGAKEQMKVMGLPLWLQGLGWFITNYVLLFISMLLCLIVLSIPEMVFPSIFYHTNFGFTLLIILLAPAACIVFSFFIATFFYNVILGIFGSMLIWLVIYWLPEIFYGLSPHYSNSNTLILLLLSLFPILNMKFILTGIIFLEQQEIGLQADNFTDEEVVGNLTISILCLMLVLQTILYGILTWYFDNLFPGPHGVSKPFYYIFTTDYWLKFEMEQNMIDIVTHKEQQSPSLWKYIGNLFKKKDEITNLDTSTFDEESEGSPIVFFEEEPEGLTKEIELINVTQALGTFTKTEVVKNVYLNVYQNQITCLLGGDGSGKTTILSIIAGLHYSFRGTVIVKGSDIRSSKGSAREKLGYCPKQNMLFKSLTPEEHLQFYGKLKGNSGERLNLKVNNLLERLQLTESRDVEAHNLSVGLTRKLHLAVALIENSTVLILDEPTAGMDYTNRREVLKLLRDARQGRTILISTTYMDEAILGDRIAVMNKGKLRCCGTPAFVKDKFAPGYHLSIHKTEKCDDEKVTKFIRDTVPTAATERKTETEIRFLLPEAQNKTFPLLLTRLQRNQIALEISSIDISVSTMDETFLNLVKIAEKETGNEEDKDLFFTDTKGHRNKGAILIIQQIYGLTLRRIHYYRRRYLVFLFLIFFPVLVLAIFLWWHSVISHKGLQEPPIILNLTTYGNTVVYYSTNNKTLGRRYYQTLPASTEIHKNKTMEYSKLASQRCKYKCVIAANLVKKGPTISAAAFYNEHFIHSLPISLNYIHNAILDYFTGDNNWKIIVENAPWAKQIDYLFWVPLEFKYFLFSLAIFLGLAILTASFIVLPIQERESGNKHLQFLTGVGSAIYWTTSFLWDFLVYLIVVILLYLTVLIIGDPKNLFIQTETLGILVLLLIIFGFATIPLVYLLSFFFSKAAIGFTAVVFLNLFSVFMLLIVITSKMYNAFWKIFDLFPAFSVSFGILKAAMITFKNLQYYISCSNNEKLLKYLCKKTHNKSDFFKCCSNCKELFAHNHSRYYSQEYCYENMAYCDFDTGILAELLVPFFMAIIFFILLFLIDADLMYRLRYLILGPDVRTYVGQFDSDLDKERVRIYKLVGKEDFTDDVLVMHDLTKYYGSFVAVDHLNLGIKKGECFGIVGEMGAGRTTTINMLSGQLKISFGDVYLNGISLKNSRGKYLREVSFCPQKDALVDYLSGREHLILFARLRGIHEKYIASTVDKLISFVELEDYAMKLVRYYSDGTKRKLSVGIALIGAPSIVFIDQATAILDPIARDKIWDILNSVKSAGISMIISSSSMEECQILCSRIAIMANGQFKCLGGIQYLKGKFGEGYTIILIPSPGLRDSEDTTELQKYIAKNFKNYTLKESRKDKLHYHIHDQDVKFGDIFSIVQTAKTQFKLKYFSICEASLDEVFFHYTHEAESDADLI